MAIAKRILAVSILTVAILTGIASVESDLQQETKQAPASRPTLLSNSLPDYMKPEFIIAVHKAQEKKKAPVPVKALQPNIKSKAAQKPVAKPVTLDKSRPTKAKQPEAVTTASAGSSESYGEWMTFTATYYNAGVASTGKSPGDDGYGITYSGRVVEDGITVAVDDDVLPLVREGKGEARWVEIKYPDGRIEKRRIDDTGSSIKGNRIDIFEDESDKTLRGPGYWEHKVQVRLIKNPVAS